MVPRATALGGGPGGRASWWGSGQRPDTFLAPGIAPSAVPCSVAPEETWTMARTIAVGIGIMEYPFDTTDGFWRWVDLCEQGGIDSIWQTDRMISRSPILECMTALAAIAGRTRRIKFGVNVVSVAM